MDSVEDFGKLQSENVRLKAALKELTVEKNLRECRLFRAFNKLLGAKKRRIKRLERTVKRLKGDGVTIDEEEYHCDTCRCKRNRQRKGTTVRRGPITPEAENDDSDATMDPGSDYGSETELDEEPPSHMITVSKSTSNVSSGTAKDNIRGSKNESSGVGNALLEHDQGDGAINASNEKEDATDNVETETNKKSSTISKEVEETKPNSQSDYEMEDLVDELCS